MQGIILHRDGVKMHGFSSRGYNGRMPKLQRPKRVNLKVTTQVKELAGAIASAMSSEESKWTETDVFEQGVLCLANRPDVRKALNTTPTPPKASGEEGE